jgi:hypothetical protein
MRAAAATREATGARATVDLWNMSPRIELEKRYLYLDRTRDNLSTE